MTDTERIENEAAAEEKSVFTDAADVSADSGAPLDVAATTPNEENDGEGEKAASGGGTNGYKGAVSESDNATDYEALAKSDLEELWSLFPALRSMRSITGLHDPLRYAALRDLGLTPKEAYLATCEPSASYDNRSHLESTEYGRRSADEGRMSRSEMIAARELFSGLSDREITRLYKKVNG